MIKKADVVLGIMILILGSASSAYIFMPGHEGGRAVIKLNGEEYGTYKLSEDRIIRIEENNHLNVVQIKDGNVAMVSSSCKNRLCVNTGKITRTSQAIVCLPNRVMVEIVGKKGDTGYDTVSN